MLGLSNGLLYRNRIKEILPFFDPNVITTEILPGVFQSDCVAWYDFTDQSSIFRDNGGLLTIGDGENIGRIKNKSTAVKRIGSFLRGDWNEAGGNGTTSNPTFKLNGVNGYSYGNFDSTASNGFGQGLSGSDYFSFEFQNSVGHGGGHYATGFSEYSYTDFDGYFTHPVGWYPEFRAHAYADPPSNNHFSLVNLENKNFTAFWVIKPSTADPSGFDQQTHWVIKPDWNDDAGANGRSQETYLEAATTNVTDEFMFRYNNEQEGASGTAYVSKGGDVTSGINVMMGVLDGGNMYFSQNGSAGIDNETIVQTSSTPLTSGLLAIGQWPLGNVHSGIVSGSSYDGEFYELIIYQRALSGAEIGTVLGALINKYN